MLGQIIDTVWRSALTFAIMLVVARMLGKSTVAQMTYHDFVASITLGAITANLAFNIKESYWQVLVSLVTFSGIAYLLMVLVLKSRKFREWFSGKPTMVIQNGKILEENLRKLKITLDTLNQELREKNIYNIEEVDYAILELNGRITVLRKPEYLPVIHKDMKMAKNVKQMFPVELVMDGQIIEENLRQNDISKQWLMSTIQSRGLTVQDVSYAVQSTSGQLFIDEYQDRLGRPIDKE